MLKCKKCQNEDMGLLSGQLLLWDGKAQKEIKFDSICASCAIDILSSYMDESVIKIRAIFDNLMNSLGRTRPVWKTVKSTDLWKKISIKLSDEEQEMIKSLWTKTFGA